ncbi:MAG TPA: DUF1194 domain-containing protein [Geminicoccaceae bacterium]
MSFRRRLAATCCVLAGAVWTSGVLHAQGLDWLVLLIDRSRSIDEDELRLQRSAYARLLNDPAVISALGEAKVAIVEFDSRAEIMVDWAAPREAAELYALQDPKGLRRQTAIGNALAAASDLLEGKRGRLVVDVSGDGRENVDPLRLQSMRAALSARAVEINGLAILNEQSEDLDRYYSQKVVNGFVLAAENRADFEVALQRKLFYEIAGRVPREALPQRVHLAATSSDAPGPAPER